MDNSIRSYCLLSQKPLTVEQACSYTIKSLFHWEFEMRINLELGILLFDQNNKVDIDHTKYVNI